MVLRDQPGHTDSGTSYGPKAATIYPQIVNFSDRRRFLYQYIEKSLLNLRAQRVIDIGAGTGPWSIFSAQNGATEVVALDYQESFVEAARENVNKLNLANKVKVVQGDAADLKFKTGSFDLALSIQVGCNLPNSGLTPHITEMARVLKPSGRVIITAPNSFGIMFTGGGQTKDKVIVNVDEILKIINVNEGNLDTKFIQTEIGKLAHIFLGTFVERQGKLILETDEKDLVSGEKIWRKLENMVVPNFYHPITQYEEEFGKANLRVVEKMNDGFTTDGERKEFNENLPDEMKLGVEYLGKPPFTVWILEKN